MKYKLSNIYKIFKEQYPNLSALELRYFEGGSNLIFFVNYPNYFESTSYVLKIIPNFKRYNFNSLDFDFIYSYKQYLANHSNVISKIYPTIKNKLFGKMKENQVEWFYSLHYFNPGVVQFPISIGDSCLIGYKLAKMHELSLNFESTYKRSYFTKSNLILEPLQMIEAKQNLFENFEYLLTIGESLASTFEEISDKKLKYVIHGDFWHGNIITNFNQAFIDFDFATYGIPEMDLATMKLLGLQHAISDKRLINSVRQMISTTLKGYRDAGKYQLDLKLVDDLTMLRAFWTISAYLKSFEYLSTEHINQKINETIKVLDFLLVENDH